MTPKKLAAAALALVRGIFALSAPISIDAGSVVSKAAFARGGDDGSEKGRHESDEREQGSRAQGARGGGARVGHEPLLAAGGEKGRGRGRGCAFGSGPHSTTDDQHWSRRPRQVLRLTVAGSPERRPR